MPIDLDKEQIALTLVTHAERKGMSILRGAASDDEFDRIINARIKNHHDRFLHGFAPLKCADVRKLCTKPETQQQSERLFYVLDTDMTDLPHHGDIFATFPNPYDDKDGKIARRSRRYKMLELLNANICNATDFRKGAFRKHCHI